MKEARQGVKSNWMSTLCSLCVSTLDPVNMAFQTKKSMQMKSWIFK